VDAADGKILWQRQLGALPQQAPLLVGDQILLRDANGLLRFDPATLGDKIGKHWRQAGEWLTQPESLDALRILLAHESSYVQLTLPRGSTKSRSPRRSKGRQRWVRSSSFCRWRMASLPRSICKRKRSPRASIGEPSARKKNRAAILC
jgi:hypothetical protein